MSLNKALAQQPNHKLIIRDLQHGGLYAISTFFAAHLLRIQFSQKGLRPVTLVENERTYELVDGDATLLVIPSRLFALPDSFAPRVVVASFVCSECGKAASMEGLPDCGCKARWNLSLERYGAAQALAVALADGNDINKAWKILKAKDGGGAAAASGYLVPLMQSILHQQCLPLGETERTYAEQGIDIARVRVRVGINPGFMPRGTHPAVAAVRTREFVAEHITDVYPEYVAYVTSSSRPIEVLNKKGEQYARLLEQTVVGLPYIDLSRHTIVASNIRQAVRFTRGGDVPCVLPTENVGATPLCLNAWTLFRDIPETAGDMLAFTPACAARTEFVRTEKFVVMPGSVLHVMDGEEIETDEEIHLATTPAGRRIIQDSVEIAPVVHRITIKGETRDDVSGEVVMNELGVIVVEILDSVSTADKFSDLFSNKGLANIIQRKATVLFAGEEIAVEAWMSPARMGVAKDASGTVVAEKHKTGAALISGALSQVAWLRFKRNACDAPTLRMPYATTIEEALHMLRCELGATAKHLTEKGEPEAEYIEQKLESLAGLEAEALANPDDADAQTNMEWMLQQLMCWPVFESIDGEHKWIGDVELSYHPFILQPQYPEVQTGTPPVVCDDRLFKEDESGDMLNIRQNSSKAGSPARLDYEGLFLQHNAPEIFEYLFKGHRDPGMEYLIALLTQSISQRGGVMDLPLTDELGVCAEV